MKKVAFETVGCRLNQYETERIAADLSTYGFRRVEFDQPADLYIINTCTVTGRADATCRNIISRAARMEGNPPVVVIGCYVDSDPDAVSILNGVDLVINNSKKSDAISILKDHFPMLFDNYNGIQTTNKITEFYQHNRAWIKIGDGCNQRCAYCVIPLVRGELTNRPVAEITGEINALSGTGYYEVVLTGVHIGQYKYGKVDSPASLVRYLLENTSISRLRLSSIEPQEVNTKLLEVMSAGGRRVCRHLHIPLQSGSDRILKIMRRPYNSAKYLDIVGRAKEAIENIVIGADIIVGFPGETREDFQESVRIANSGLLDYLHVFSYSDRPGTASMNMPDKVNPEIIKDRNSILRDISSIIYARALAREIGNELEMISEHRARSGEYYWGISDNYLRVAIPLNLGGGRDIIKMKITGCTGRHLIGEFIQ
jgi:threonylcarbamoyladenosine tRNA methylthiotransferase MtaB